MPTSSKIALGNVVRWPSHVVARDEVEGLIRRVIVEMIKKKCPTWIFTAKYKHRNQYLPRRYRQDASPTNLTFHSRTDEDERLFTRRGEWDVPHWTKSGKGFVEDIVICQPSLIIIDDHEHWIHTNIKGTSTSFISALVNIAERSKIGFIVTGGLGD